MTTDELNKKVKRRNKVSELLKQELELLIKQAGYNKNVNNDLQSFARIGGGSDAGISDTKIRWVLNDSILPREDFLYALATISVKVKGASYYKRLKVDNPMKYEIEHFLTLCDYGITPGSIFPANNRFRRNISIKPEQYLSSIPGIFWNMDIPFEDIINFFYNKIRYSEQSIIMDSNSILTFGVYNYKRNDSLGQIASICIEDNSIPDAFSFRIDNNSQQLRFKSIEAIRNMNNARILIVLLNENWIELTNTKTEYCGYTWTDLDVDNYYNSADLELPDNFFLTTPKGFEKEWTFLTMEKLHDKLATNQNYREAHKQLTLMKK